MTVATDREPHSQQRNSLFAWVSQTPLGKSVVQLAASRRFYQSLGVVMLLGYIAILTVGTWMRPGYNWDMTAYVSTVLENRIEDPVARHAETWRIIEQGASADDLQKLRFASEYSRHQWENPDDFATMLNFYRMKVGYIELARLVEPIFGLDKGLILLSIVPSVMFGFFCLWWLNREDVLEGAIILTPALALVDYLHMFTVVSPDMLGTVLTGLAVFSMTRNKDGVACALLLSAIMLRPDSIVLLFAFVIAALLFGWNKTLYLLTFLVGVVIVLTLQKSGGYVGWWRHLYFSLIEQVGTLVNFDPPFSFAVMSKAYANGAAVALATNRWPAALLLMVIIWGLIYRAGRLKQPRINAIIFALAISVAGKFASFPLPEDRLYFPAIACMALLLVIALKPRFDLGYGGAKAS